ncbi:unnamed protein product (macronuclear) [Paramecium tetraurelia]|uniref:RWP-RK domain-containing protein n=1 Tax=Paramecium tetraurelia TaxID=5888 RepID=A0BZ36_PARTE|nr:uncharacterized protein GSPATT00033656001 [Paramecium tetraurelia]CAK63803.1 unnamed protein product [Paramecium tetraurelia]|eukprot:XP_001431201.1 hypothetical protein (macronuclear) [Paramecium tetraurelia strain d4-2]
MVLENKVDNQDISEIPSPTKASGIENRLRGNDDLNQMQKSNRKYMKVTLQTKQLLYQMVQMEGIKIKEVMEDIKLTQAARILGIKYATAKTIVYHRRQKRKERGKCGLRMCGYTELVDNRVSRLQIISITGNDAKQCKEYIL